MTQELDNLNELKELFQQKRTGKIEKISQDEIIKESTNEIENLKKQNFKQYFLFLATTVALTFINSVSSEKIETSKLGFGILLGCSLYYALSKVFLNQKLAKITPVKSANENLKSLIQYNNLNTFLSTYLEFIYAIILSVGVYVYMQPIIEANNSIGNNFPLIAKIVWIAYLAWAFIHTFIIKRKQLKKEQAILEKLILDLNN